MSWENLSHSGGESLKEGVCKCVWVETSENQLADEVGSQGGERWERALLAV